MEYLLKSNYLRIGFVGRNLDDLHLLDRYNGWKSVCQKYNIEHEFDLASITLEGGYIASKCLISKFKPDAVFVVCDVMALGAINYFDETPYKIGIDIGIMWFDDIYASNFIGLSTMHQLLHEKIIQMMQYIVSFNVKEYNLEHVKKISFTPVVIERKSTKRHYEIYSKEMF